MVSTKKINVEIWSDIACPFCYIGKRNFENALAEFPHKNNVEIKWHSFQLDPTAKKDSKTDMFSLLSTKYGVSYEQAKQMTQRVTDMAKESGLNFYLDKAIPTNTLDAHRLTHLALKHGLQDKAKELLFLAYLTEGKNLGDSETLISLGADIGINPKEVRDMLESKDYIDEVLSDSEEGKYLGLTGVPFFVINKNYAISGAQPSKSFLEILKNIWQEEENNKPDLEAEECSIEGVCK